MKRFRIVFLFVLQTMLFAFVSVPGMAQGTWGVYSYSPTQGYPMTSATAGGSGMVNSGGSFGSSSITFASQATATETGGPGSTNQNANYTLQDKVIYFWSGMGPPAQVFYVNVNSVKATASFSASAVGSIVGNSTGSVSTDPSSSSASVRASQYQYSPPDQTPAAYKYQFSTNGNAYPSWIVTANSQAAVSVLYGTGTGTANASSTMSLDAPTAQ